MLYKGSNVTKNMLTILFKYKKFFILLFLFLTGFFAYEVSMLRIADDPNKWPPKKDPNVILNDKMQEIFGGANTVVIQITTKKGDIFNFETLAKIVRINTKVLAMDGILPYNVRSIADSKVKYFKGTEDFLYIEPLMTVAPETPKQIERLKYGIYSNPAIYGVLVSPDAKSALIIADYKTGEKNSLTETTTQTIYNDLNNNILKAERDDNHIIRCAGTPIIVGWVNTDGVPFIIIAFICFLVAMVVVLIFAFKNVQGVVVPITLGIVGSIWGFGLTALLMGGIIRSSSALLAPFIITAAAVCHSVQFLRRFYQDEYRDPKRVNDALTNTVVLILPPLLASLITDVAGFVVCAFIPFENVRVLGIATALGLGSVLISMVLFLLPLVSLIPGRPMFLTGNPGGSEEEGSNKLERFILRIVKILVGENKARWGIIGGLGVIVIISLTSFSLIEIGQDNTYAIHNFVTKSWRNNPIFLMEQEIKEKFKGVYPLNILIEAKTKDGLKEPKNLRKVEAFAKFLEGIPKVAGTFHLPQFIKLMNKFNMGGDDKYFVIPESRTAVGEYLYNYSLGEPGSFDAVVDWNYQNSSLIAYVEDTQHSTVKNIITKAQKYAQNQFNDDQITATVGGGSIGIADAFNRNIKKYLLIAILASTFCSFVAIVILIRSFIGGIFLLIPEIITLVIWFWIIYISGIEVNSNATSSLAILMGVGVDAEMYYLFRFREEFKRTKDFTKSLITGFAEIRQALIFSNLALIVGCWSLIPIPLYVGYVGYSMGMSLFIAFIVSFIVDPFLWKICKPNFLIKGL